MLLQVHDELVFEAPDDEIEATIGVVRKVIRERLFHSSNCRSLCRSTPRRRRTGTRRP